MVNLSKKPVLNLIDGTEIELPRPTMKMWRMVAEYDEIDKSDWNILQLMDGHSKIIAEMFSVSDIEKIAPEDVLPKYMEAAGYVIGIVNSKLKKIPNAETVEGQE